MFEKYERNELITECITIHKNFYKTFSKIYNNLAKNSPIIGLFFVINIFGGDGSPGSKML